MKFSSFLKTISYKNSFDILECLYNNNKVHFNEILKVTKYHSTASRLLKKLESLEILKREVLDDPNRSVLYSLNNNGKLIFKQLLKLKEIFKSF